MLRNTTALATPDTNRRLAQAAGHCSAMAAVSTAVKKSHQRTMRAGCQRCTTPLATQGSAMHTSEPTK
ncbi:hypothetical protein D3C72_2385840 [compost metagenome]